MNCCHCCSIWDEDAPYPVDLRMSSKLYATLQFAGRYVEYLIRHIV